MLRGMLSYINIVDEVWSNMDKLWFTMEETRTNIIFRV